MPAGKVIILSAPSGSGKTTLVRHLLESRTDLGFSVSATSRKQREGEQNGIDYHFLSPEEFRTLIENKAFLEWEEVYPGIFYGSLISKVDKMLSQGQHVVFDVDVVGGLNIKQHYGKQALSIFVKAPSIDIMAQRLHKRGTESDESLKSRLEKAAWELTFADKFDVVILNDTLEVAKAELNTIVNTFIKSD
ncbi:MAG: guanylate kinase [Bacteroidales bacterium]|nr:guanylate kinase [Bacteroidales bacterium]